MRSRFCPHHAHIESHMRVARSVPGSPSPGIVLACDGWWRGTDLPPLYPPIEVGRLAVDGLWRDLPLARLPIDVRPAAHPTDHNGARW